jgi:glycosyltransferase involved in cell wall biosynthesis
VNGGAARAANRWRRCLGDELAGTLTSQNVHKRLMSTLLSRLEVIFFYKWDRGAYGNPSLNLFGHLKYKQIADFFPNESFFVHWVQGNFISLRTLSKISSRSIFYAHDEWLLTGIGHYSGDKSSNPTWQRFLGLLIQRYKSDHILRTARHIVTPSAWLKQKFVEAGIDEGRISVIPNPIIFDSSVSFSLIESRKSLGIEKHEKVILVLSDSPASSFRKGFDLFIEAIERISETDTAFTILTAGMVRIPKIYSPKIRLVDVGYIKDDIELQKLYLAADLVVVPSRFDNFPQVSTESQWLGTPVMVFNETGTPETVLEQNFSGVLVSDLSSAFLADELEFFLSHSIYEFRLRREKIVKLAEEKWASKVLHDKFLKLHMELG